MDNQNRGDCLQLSNTSEFSHEDSHRLCTRGLPVIINLEFYLAYYKENPGMRQTITHDRIDLVVN